MISPHSISIFNDGAKRQIMIVYLPRKSVYFYARVVKVSSRHPNPGDPKNKSKLRFFDRRYLEHSSMISDAYLSTITLSNTRSEQTNYIYNCCYRIRFSGLSHPSSVAIEPVDNHPASLQKAH